MSLRTRITLAASAAVVVVLTVASFVSYLALRNQLRGEVDDSLRAAVGQVERSGVNGLAIELPVGPLGGTSVYAQLSTSKGPIGPRQLQRLPVERRVRKVANGRERAFFRDTRVKRVHVRVLTERLGPDLAVQLSRPLAEQDRTLARYRLLLLLITGSGAAIAALLGLLVARATLVPVTRLTKAAEEITATHDLSRRVQAQRGDELGRLALSFNSMLAELEGSLKQQSQLVADASHELRTPVTSLRTNLELLARSNGLTDPARRSLLSAAVRQAGDLSRLVGDLIELARGGERSEQRELVRFDLLVAEAVERMRQHAAGIRFETSLQPTLVHAVTSRLARAVLNLLENAVKWSPPGGSVEVELRKGELSVRDRGPGIAEADLPHIFDRFYRAAVARKLPGSGLGLAIVRQVAEEHGGSVAVTNPPGGGACLRLRLPLAAESASPRSTPFA